MSKFILLGSQRTGSNLLVNYLNQYDDIFCNGEFFNPAFTGINKSTIDYIGLTREDVKQREKDRFYYLEKVFNHPGKEICGFVFFPGHGDDIFRNIMKNSNISKIFLHRNPIQSYVSLKIAQETRVWLVANIKNSKKINRKIKNTQRKIVFKPYIFKKYMKNLTSFRKNFDELFDFYGGRKYEISYSQLKNHETINQLALFLGSKDTPKILFEKLVKQNPNRLEDKVENYDELLKFAERQKLLHLL